MMVKLYWPGELPDVQAGFRKGRGTRDQIANLRWIMEKAREFQKTIYYCFIDYAKAFDCVDHFAYPALNYGLSWYDSHFALPYTYLQLSCLFLLFSYTCLEKPQF